MRLQAPAALFLIAALTFSANAAAIDLAAALTWKLDFGPSTVKPSAGLTLGYTSADPKAPQAQLVRVEVSDVMAMTQVAGLPLFSRTYRANEAAGAHAAPVERAWYSRSWLLWTLGGLAATAALSSSGGRGGSGGGGEGTCTGVCGDHSGFTAAGQDVPNGPCAGDTCVVCGGTVVGGCPDFVRRSTNAALAARVHAKHQAGTGGMGDLLPVAR